MCFESQNRAEADERTGTKMYGKNEEISLLPEKSWKNSPNLLNRDFHAEKPKMDN